MEDSAGRMTNSTSVSSDVCDNGACAVVFSTSSQICSIGIVVANEFGSSDMISTNIGKLITVTHHQCQPPPPPPPFPRDILGFESGGYCCKLAHARHVDKTSPTMKMVLA